MHSQFGKPSSTARRLRAVRPAHTLLALASALALLGAAHAQNAPDRTARVSLAQAALSGLMVTQSGGAQEAVASDAASTGMVRVIVQFTEPSVVESQQVSGLRARAVSRATMSQQAAGLRSAKAERVSAIASLGGRVQNTIEYSLNAAVVA